MGSATTSTASTQTLPAGRWLSTRGATHPGFAVEGGRVALLGGRRVWIGPAGPELLSETAEPLQLLALVPRGAHLALAGASRRAVYVFDELRGPGRLIARANDRISDLLGAPERVGVGTWKGRVWLDLEGAVAAGGRDGLALLPLEPDQLAYASPTHAIASFPCLGSFFTADGGQHWKPLDLSPRRVRADVDGLVSGNERIDAVTGARTPLPHTDSALVRWLRTVERGPLALAVTSGLWLGGERGLVAGGDQLFELDLATGFPVRTLRFAYVLDDDARSSEWLLRRGAKAGSAYLFPARGAPGPLFEVSFGPGELDAQPVHASGSRTGEVIVASSGGLAFEGPCHGDDEAAVAAAGQPMCVQQPSGAFKSMRSPFSAERLSPSRRGELVAVMADEHGELAFARHDAQGTVTRGAPLPVAKGWSFELEQRIDEVESGHFVALGRLSDAAATSVRRVLVREKQGRVTMHDLPASANDFVAMGAGRVVVWGRDTMAISSDGGATWERIASPEGEPFSVSELGVAGSDVVRLGWGPGLPAPAVAEPASDTRYRRVSFACEPRGPTPSPGVLRSDEVFAAALRPRSPPDELALSPYAQALVRATVSVSRPSRNGPRRSGTIGFAWLDEHEVPARLRSVTSPLSQELAPEFSEPPKPRGGTSSDLFVAGSAAVGERGAFLLVRGDQVFAGRTNRGSVELTKVPEPGYYGFTTLALAFDGALAWEAAGALYYWPAKGALRVIAQVEPERRMTRSLHVGAPTAQGVPLWIGRDDWSAFRMIAIPKEGEEPLRLGLDGWARSPFPPGDPSTLPACAASPPKSASPLHRLVSHDSNWPISLPAFERSGSSPLFWVRANAVEACLEGFAASLSGDPPAVVRADLVKQSFELAVRGKATTAMSCRRE